MAKIVYESEIIAEAELAELLAGYASAVDALIALEEQWVTLAGGQHIDIGATGEGRKATTAEIAKLSHKGGSKYEQTIANESEKELAAALEMPRTPDNRPFDLQTEKVGIECKTFVSNTRDKISMNKSAIAKKDAERLSSKLKKTFTVVVDKRTYDANGKVTGVAGPAFRFYVRGGYGSYKTTTMKEFASMKEVKAYIATAKGVREL